MSIFSPEDALLSVLLTDNAHYWRVADTVCEQDFTGNRREIFAAIRDAKGERVDCFTLAASHGDEIGREAMDIACNVASSAGNVESYARQVAEAGEKRRVRESGKRIALASTYAEAQQLLAEVRPMQTARLKSAKDGLREMMEALQVRFAAESVVTGVPTGLASLDEITGGWQPGDLVGVGGYTSSGKTAFALQAAIASGRCYYVSLEMMAAQLWERVVSCTGHIPYRAIRFPREADQYDIDRMYGATERAMALPLIVDDQPGLTVEQIGARARQLHMVDPLRMVVVDHLNLIRRPRKHDAGELGEIAISLKNLAKELGVPVMILVQLNRAARQKADQRPDLDAFRNSGEIEEALDTAVMVYRDEYFNPEGPLKGYAEFIVRKQRQGERNVTAWARSMLSQMRFESCDEPELTPAPQAKSGFGRFGAAA